MKKREVRLFKKSTPTPNTKMIDTLGKLDWEKQFHSTLKESSYSSNDLVLYKKLLSALDDAHVQVESGNSSTDAFPGIYLEYIEDKVIVSNAFQRLKEYQGYELVSIDSISVDSLLPQTKLSLSYGVEIRSKWGDVKQYVFKDTSNLLVPVDLYSRYSDFQHYQLKENPHLDDICKINDNLTYLNLFRITADRFRKILPNIESDESLILDMRGYPKISGKDSKEIISHFLQADDTIQWMQVPKINAPNSNFEVIVGS